MRIINEKKSKKHIYKSDCCKAPTINKGIPDFIGSKEICTVHCECSKCSEPCDIYISPKQQARVEREALKEKIGFILDNLLGRFLPRPVPQFVEYIKSIEKDKKIAIKEIMEAVNGSKR